MKKLLFITISLILLVVGCAPKRMVKISGPMCPECGEKFDSDTTFVDKDITTFQKIGNCIFFWSIYPSAANARYSEKCNVYRRYGFKPGRNTDTLCLSRTDNECSEFAWIKSDTLYDFYYRLCHSCYIEKRYREEQKREEEKKLKEQKKEAENRK